MTPKNIHKISIPQKIFIFLKTPKNIEIQNFEPQKMGRVYVCVKISEYPPPPPPIPPPPLGIPKCIHGVWENNHSGVTRIQIVFEFFNGSTVAQW